jgi:hypothetical protein
MLTEESLLKKLKEKGPAQAAKFSWEKTVATILDAINN